MSQAEELLNNLVEDLPQHQHPVVDDDSYFLIDPETRVISNGKTEPNVVMQHDHNSERYTFEVPRYVDGHDMTLCNVIKVHWNNIDGETGEENASVYDAYDLKVNPNNKDTVIFTWLIHRESTQLVGTLNFLIQYICEDEDGTIVYEWHTDMYTNVLIKKTRNNGDEIVQTYPDLLEQWRAKLFGAGDSVIEDIIATTAEQQALLVTESETQQAAIELKGSETLATIPEDYSATYNLANEGVRTKADAIVCEASGTGFMVTDASDDYIRGLNVYGKTTQATTTGKNLFTVDETLTHPLISYDETTQKITVSAGEIGIVQNLHYLTKPIPAGTNVTITVWCDSGYIESGSSVTFGGYHEDESGNSWQCDVGIPNQIDLANKRYTTSVVTTADVTSMVFFANAGSTITTDLVCRVQYELDAESTDYEPYTGGMAAPNPDYPQDLVSIENPTVNIYGKNLYTSGDIELNGDSKTEALFIGPVKTPVTLSWTQDFDRSTGSALFSYKVAGDIYYTAAREFAGRHSVYINKDGMLDEIILLNWSKETGNLTDIQIEIGSVLTEYESPKGTQSITLPRPISGLPVTFGGNYTDENGQQWICDEVDLERGVYVQRVYSRVFDGADGETIMLYAERENVYGFTLKFTDASMQKIAHPAFCTHFENIEAGISSANKECFLCGAGSASIYVLINKDRLTEYSVDAFKTWLSENPITILFQLATPIETPLTAEEIETYKTLKTDYPNTTILNDSGAWMKVEYNADTKSYITNTMVSVLEGIENGSY